jgi:hypothetical protein
MSNSKCDAFKPKYNLYKIYNDETRDCQELSTGLLDTPEKDKRVTESALKIIAELRKVGYHRFEYFMSSEDFAPHLSTREPLCREQIKDDSDMSQVVSNSLTEQKEHRKKLSKGQKKKAQKRRQSARLKSQHKE